MRLWQKVFISTFILFEIVFNSATFYLIQYNFNQSLQGEIKRGLSEQFVIYSGLQINGTLFKERLAYSPDALNDFISANSQNFSEYFNKEAFLEILDQNNKIIFSSFNLKYDGNREELKVPLSEKRYYIIRDIGEKVFLFVTNEISIQNDHYKVSYIRDISTIYSDKSKQYSLLVKLNLVVTFILAIGLYLLLWYLTSPIRALTKSAKRIAGGNFSERVNEVSKDEIGILSDSFNQMASAIQEKVDELEYNSMNKQHFIECLTHELKTPLTSIIGYADLLRSIKYNEEVFIKGLTHIYKEGKHLESLSFKLMDLILLSNEKLEKKNEDIRLICLGVVEALSSCIEEKNIEIITDIQPHMVLIEHDLFISLITNLLDNAIKASHNGKCIYVRGAADDTGQYILEIEDQGIGIPEKDIPCVFEPFFMVDKSRSRANKGAGLGLAICSKIIELHNGKIEISSKIDEGTKVKITIPTLYN